MTREIVLDTETTGLNPAEGHRIVEIGALEMINHVPTGKTFHVYINPERPIDPDAIAVHGITDERVAGEPVFADIADAFIEFLGASKLVIHNASFDMGFINAELERLGQPQLPADRAIDTLMLARRKFPGAQASLDALCRRFNIDNSHRELHGAMVDTDLLADVYIELIGGRQPGLTLNVSDQAVATDQTGSMPSVSRTMRPPRPHDATADEIAAHNAFIDRLPDPLWRQVSGNHSPEEKSSGSSL
ncbi:MAG: DNA polymerase III subunit epsilon [Alphaproteobacteria bacterium]|nr:DNA polymerase III subunit epsilon [Alphaproteobacteria bacterium]